MNKQFFLLTVSLVIFLPLYSADTATSLCACSHSFFSIRPPFQNSTPENVALFYNDAPLRRDCGWSGAIEVVGFGGTSTRAKDLARFFTPNCSNTVIFAESSAFDGLLATDPNLRDVNAVYFNIRTVENNFASIVQFSPRQTYAGIGFAWKQYFDWWRCDQCPRLWCEVSFPVEWIKNDMRLTESIIHQGTPLSPPDVYTSIKEAFTCTKSFFNFVIQATEDSVAEDPTKQNFGCIDGAQKKMGVADVEFKIGYDFINLDCCHLDGYVGFVGPTGNKPTGRYVFEPIIGNNHHWAIMWGGSYRAAILQRCNYQLSFEMILNGRYLFENAQVRSFDLAGKPWSRYMLLYANAADAAAQNPIEAINFLTDQLRVTPGAQQHSNASFIFEGCNFQVAAGCHCWFAQCERVKLKNPFPTGLAQVNLTEADTTDANINRAITIKENFSSAGVEYAAPLTIVESDLNLGSAAMPCSLTYAVYGSLGYYANCLPVFFGVGGSYEWTPKKVNTALNRWMVWGKIGLSI